MSTGHASVEDGDRPSVTPVPATSGAPSNGSGASVARAGTAPGCHVRVGRVWVEATAPAAPACATRDPATDAGNGAADTIAVVGAVADCAPPLPVAVTTSDS